LTKAFQTMQSMMNSGGQSRPRRLPADLSTITCFNCGIKGHYQTECTEPPRAGGRGGPIRGKFPVRRTAARPEDKVNNVTDLSDEAAEMEEKDIEDVLYEELNFDGATMKGANKCDKHYPVISRTLTEHNQTLSGDDKTKDKEESEFAMEQRRDPSLVNFFRWLEGEGKEIPPGERSWVQSQAEDMLLHRGILYKRHQSKDSRVRDDLRLLIALPVKYREAALYESHDSPSTGGHLAFYPTYSRLHSNYWWPGMWKDIDHYVKSIRMIFFAGMVLQYG
jgi:hypothetical protein